MAIKTQAELKESFQRMSNRKVYAQGERIEDVTEHPYLKPAFLSRAKFCDFMHNPEYKDKVTTKSTIAPEEEIGYFSRLYDTPECLVERFKNGRWVRRFFPRTAGSADSINAVWSTTYDCDRKYNTNYHERFVAFLKNVHKKGLTCSICQTDAKGDRSKRPIEQTDPDVFVHKVKTLKDGIIVSGAKAHQSSSIFCHEIICMPTRRMQEDEKDFSIGFAVPADTEGLIQICGRQPSDLRRLDGMDMDSAMPEFGGSEALVIFDNVFVPWDRVFLNGEWDFTTQMMETFANFHRVLYALKCNLGDIIIGAAAQIAEYNGAAMASHIQSKLADMVILNETMYSCGLAAAHNPVRTPSGVWHDDKVLSNVVKNNVTKNMYEICRLAEDIAGGSVTTQPSEKDWRNPETKPYIEKYLKGVDHVPTEHRMRMFKLIEFFTYGQGSTYSRAESMHGAGAPEMQKVFIRRMYDFESLKRLARMSCGIEEMDYSK